MKRYLLITGTVTYASKGRDLLRRYGFNPKIERITGGPSTGCGYAVSVDRDAQRAVELFAENKIKLLGVEERK